jgi:hypothetical protein
MSWAGHVARTGERIGTYRVFFLRWLKERAHLEDLCAVGRIILKRIFSKWEGEAFIRLIWLRRWRGGWFL